MKIISTNDQLAPKGHYSQAIIHQNTIYISGQLSIDPQTGQKCTGDIGSETLRVLQNIEHILSMEGCNRFSIIRTTVYISNIEEWEIVNKVYADFFGDHKPARTVVPTRSLHYGFKVEIDAVAALA